MNGGCTQSKYKDSHHIVVGDVTVTVLKYRNIVVTQLCIGAMSPFGSLAWRRPFYVEFSCSPRVCMASPWVVQLPLTVYRVMSG